MSVAQTQFSRSTLFATATISSLLAGCASNQSATSPLAEQTVESRLMLNMQDTNREFDAIRANLAANGRSLETFGLHPQTVDGKLGGKTVQLYQIVADGGKLSVKNEVLVTIQGETFSLPAAKRVIPLTRTVNMILASENPETMKAALTNFDLTDGQNYYASNTGPRFGEGAAEEFFKSAANHPRAEKMYQAYVGSVQKTNPDAPKVLPGCNLTPPLELTFLPVTFTLHSELGVNEQKENAVGAILRFEGKKIVAVIDDKAADEITTTAIQTVDLVRIVQETAARQSLVPLAAK